MVLFDITASWLMTEKKNQKLNLGWQYRMFSRGSYPYHIYSIEKYEAMTVMVMCHNKAVTSSNSWNTKGWEVNFWWDQKSGAKKKKNS